MKNRVLLLLTIAILFFMPVTTQAGFLVKKQTTVHSAVAGSAARAFNETTTETISSKDAVAALTESASPSSSFVRFWASGKLGMIAFIFGILGFLLPVFSVGAVLFGFIGFMYPQVRKKGFAIAGFILGVAAIVGIAFAGLAPLPIF